jgi:ribose 5-phosphate isomerase A
MTATQDELKQKAAYFAVEWIQSGMILGLGTGSTAEFALKRIAERISAGELKHVVGVPSSVRTEKMARELGIPLTDLDSNPEIDLTIDGADEVDPDLNLIKGGGGALLREKILAQATRRNVIIVDESKLSPQLGTKWALPIEVIPFACRSEQQFLAAIGGHANVRNDKAGHPFITDQQNYIMDANFGRMADPRALAERLNARAGIVEHGLFIGLAADVVVAAAAGVRHLTRK